MTVFGLGSSAASDAFQRALTLSRQLPSRAPLAPVLIGLWNFYHSRAELDTARELAQESLAIAQQEQDRILLHQGHYTLAWTLGDLGMLSDALSHLEQSAALYGPEQHTAHMQFSVYDTGVGCHCFASHVLWLLGYAEQAQQRNRQALRLARDLAHPETLAGALCMAAILAQWGRDAKTAHHCAEEALDICQQYDLFNFRGWATLMRGWSLSAQGQMEAGIAQLRQGLEVFRAAGVISLQPYWHALLAEALAQHGQVDESLHLLDEGLELIRKHQERRWEAELYRLKGVWLARQAHDNASRAEACLQQALSIARQQQAKAFELRAATSLAQSRLQQGQAHDAHDLLGAVYSGFTEGFATADLQEAKALLATAA